MARIRPYNGTLADAQGIVAVDAETLSGCPYSPPELARILSTPGLWTALAVAGEEVVGFVSAFPTHSLAGDRWEVDQVAVRPAYQGRGIGTALVACAMGAGAGQECPARAFVATHNAASRRAFARVGFRAAHRVDLLLYEVAGRVPRPAAPELPQIRAATPGDVERLAAVGGGTSQRMSSLLAREANRYLLAERAGIILGTAELLHVRTVQYEGLWLESVSPPAAGPDVLQALARAAVEAAKRDAAIDAVGAMVGSAERALHAACVREGFRYVESYDEYTREAPPVGSAPRTGRET